MTPMTPRPLGAVIAVFVLVLVLGTVAPAAAQTTIWSETLVVGVVDFGDGWTSRGYLDYGTRDGLWEVGAGALTFPTFLHNGDVHRVMGVFHWGDQTRQVADIFYLLLDSEELPIGTERWPLAGEGIELHVGSEVFMIDGAEWHSVADCCRVVSIGWTSRTRGTGETKNWVEGQRLIVSLVIPAADGPMDPTSPDLLIPPSLRPKFQSGSSRSR